MFSFQSVFYYILPFIYTQNSRKIDKVKTQSFQNKLDSFFDRYLLFLIPRTFKPNHFTYLRIILVPIIYWLLTQNLTLFAFFLFLFAASTDFIDGSLARTRGQETDLGKVLDPVADKMLISSVLIYIGFEYLIVKIFLIFIALEIIAILTSVIFSFKMGRPISANVFGKIKMILQTASVIMFLVGIFLKLSKIILLSEYILFIALFFAFISGVIQIHRQLSKRKRTANGGPFFV